ncbi:LPS assembly protein LptD, partial [Erwinia amylovora]|nr:LPS assembly protein LptD [Erwinia amylovora]
DDLESSRWLFHCLHAGVYFQIWRFNSDYTNVRDPWYFTYLDSPYGSTSDVYVTKYFFVGYAE